ncbi:MAG: hypothetical protein PF689_11505 [Deltaproteobacteria bacterium]|jgi:hypothetical protein|nr:hypothetical protein [Deltaproteobacteria bacterium]
MKYLFIFSTAIFLLGSCAQGNNTDDSCPVDHCSNEQLDCDEEEMDCGGEDCDSCECIPNCTDYSCGQEEPVCGTTCGDPCDPGCMEHCSNNILDCDESDIDCGGINCEECECIPNCTGYACGQIEPLCSTTCGDPCDSGCVAHCSNSILDCDETGTDCGGAICSTCPCVPDCTGYGCGQVEPVCGSICGNICDPGCTGHCSNGFQDCDETAVDCGGAACSACPCIPDCTGYSCGQIEPTCGTTCGNPCDFGCTGHCSNSIQDCDETGIDCGGAACSACSNGCGINCYYWAGTCNSSYIDACDGCDLGCEVHDPDCDDPGSTCLSDCSCLAGYSHWYCDEWDDCTDSACECAGE